jgi:hypothetical protein
MMKPMWIYGVLPLKKLTLKNQFDAWTALSTGKQRLILRLLAPADRLFTTEDRRGPEFRIEDCLYWLNLIIDKKKRIIIKIYQEGCFSTTLMAYKW